jgi:hypothetical protein
MNGQQLTRLPVEMVYVKQWVVHHLTWYVLKPTIIYRGNSEIGLLDRAEALMLMTQYSEDGSKEHRQDHIKPGLVYMNKSGQLSNLGIRMLPAYRC